MSVPEEALGTRQATVSSFYARNDTSNSEIRQKEFGPALRLRNRERTSGALSRSLRDSVPTPVASTGAVGTNELRQSGRA